MLIGGKKQGATGCSLAGGWIHAQEETNCLIDSFFAVLKRTGDKCVFIFYMLILLSVHRRVTLRCVIFLHDLCSIL